MKELMVHGELATGVMQVSYDEDTGTTQIFVQHTEDMGLVITVGLGTDRSPGISSMLFSGKEGINPERGSALAQIGHLMQRGTELCHPTGSLVADEALYLVFGV